MQMNERIKELALDAGLLNYVDNETPRRYFIDGHADLEEVEKFAELLIRKCAQICFSESKGHNMAFGEHCGIVIKEHFGVE
jgi:hypothetical protein